jgi:hypothetical protein
VNPAALKPSRFGWQSKTLEQFIFKSGLLSGAAAKPPGGVLFHQLAGYVNLKFAWAAESKYDLPPSVHTASQFSFGAKGGENNGQSYAGFAAIKSSS